MVLLCYFSECVYDVTIYVEFAFVLVYDFYIMSPPLNINVDVTISNRKLVEFEIISKSS